MLMKVEHLALSEQVIEVVLIQFNTTTGELVLSPFDGVSLFEEAINEAR